MGTLLRRATLTSFVALAAFAALPTSLLPAIGSQVLPKDSVAASAGTVGTPASGQLVVVGKRVIDSERGWLIYTDGLGRDSTVLELRVLQHLKPGDLLSDGGGTIDR